MRDGSLTGELPELFYVRQSGRDREFTAASPENSDRQTVMGRFVEFCRHLKQFQVSGFHVSSRMQQVRYLQLETLKRET
jgi:hypothetical protein